MSSVTQRVKEVTQPRGGYIKPSSFKETKLLCTDELSPMENIHASVVGMAVDYLTRMQLTNNPENAFSISLMGASIAERLGKRGAVKTAKSLLRRVRGLDAESIICACKLVTFDVWLRNPVAAFTAKPAELANPDADTIRNIRIMVERSMSFFDEYGPITAEGFTFPGGYTRIVDSGDGDFLTSDTMWDFKVSKSKPTSKHTLQLLMYWIMGQHSNQNIYKTITKLGIFNPRLNSVYLLPLEQIPTSTIQAVESGVLCY